MICAGCGSQTTQTAAPAAATVAPTVHAHPQAVEPVAGAGAQAQSTPGAPAAVSVGPPNGALARPTSLATVRKQLTASGLSANPNQATLTNDGLAISPINAPAAVQEVINAGNEIARLPYVWGGGHQTYEDTGYDCSGSLSFILAAAGLLNQTETSGQLMNGATATRVVASGSRSSPTRVTRSRTSAASGSTRSRSPRPGRAGRTARPTSRTCRASRSGIRPACRPAEVAQARP